MAGGFDYHFEWDAAKAESNRSQHGIPFELAATVFNDPLTVSIADAEHSQTEERWITIGQAQDSKLLVVIHTFDDSSSDSAIIRIISARQATQHEQRQYETS